MSPIYGTSKEWSRAFARQALSDLDARELLDVPTLSRCHSLHFLQMAAEKVCKAYLHATGNTVKQSHSVVRKHLPSIARDLSAERAMSGSRLKALKHLAVEIDLLAPALRGEGTRQDNVEYPWESTDGIVIAPIDFAFSPIEDNQIRALVKLLRLAASKYSS